MNNLLTSPPATVSLSVKMNTLGNCKDKRDVEPSVPGKSLLRLQVIWLLKIIRIVGNTSGMHQSRVRPSEEQRIERQTVSVFLTIYSFMRHVILKSIMEREVWSTRWSTSHR